MRPVPIRRSIYLFSTLALLALAATGPARSEGLLFWNKSGKDLEPPPNALYVTPKRTWREYFFGSKDESAEQKPGIFNRVIPRRSSGNKKTIQDSEPRTAAEMMQQGKALSKAQITSAEKTRLNTLSRIVAQNKKERQAHSERQISEKKRLDNARAQADNVMLGAVGRTSGGDRPPVGSQTQMPAAEVKTIYNKPGDSAKPTKVFTDYR